MKTKILSLIFFTLLIFINSQTLKFETLLQDKISIRALQIDKGKVYYSGTDSKFGFVDLKNTNEKKQIILSDKKLQFRTLAQDNNAFYTINIESPANFFKINKKTFKYKVFQKDSAKNAFYDALHLSNGKFYTFSDPEDDLEFKLVQFSDKNGNYKFRLKTSNHLHLNKGEAAFAASNTNIASSSNYLWVATGGKSSRIFRINLHTQKWEVFETDFVQGTSSQGIYSIDFYKDNFGIAVGGDYTKQAENLNNIATTFDAGKTWKIQAFGKNAGYSTCVKIRPGSKGKQIITVGDQHISFSNDFGNTWTKISDEKNLYVCDWIDENTLVFAGKDRILKAVFKN